MMRFAFLVLSAALAFPAVAARPKGTLECKPTGTDFVYDCTIRLTQDGQPLKNVRISVGADMPTMPMAHNVKPVVAQPTGEPGVYRATLDLEMLGLWAVKLRLSGPVRDLLILRYEFDEKGATPAGKSPRAMPQGGMQHGNAMKHDGMKPGGQMPHGGAMPQQK